MDTDSVAGIVLALLVTYDSGLEYYTKWQRNQWQANHYTAHEKGSLSGSGCCGLSTSLSFSGRKIREAFDGGANALGETFECGDELCCDQLLRNLEQLQDGADILYEAMTGASDGPLSLSSLLRLSESVRASSLAALQGLHRRITACNNIQSDSQATWETGRRPSVVNLESVPEDDEKSTLRAESVADMTHDDDRTTTYTATPPISPYQSEPPPSPPLTPPKVAEMKLAMDAAEDTDRKSMYRHSMYAASTISGFTVATSATDATFGPRPMNSVFSIFCPEAMKYQLDPGRSIPTEGSCDCCGYQWWDSSVEKRDAVSRLFRRDKRSHHRYASSVSSSSSSSSSSIHSFSLMTVKDGFRITPRFLAKSHCRVIPPEGGESRWVGGYGCVLCTSKGRSAVYEDVSTLRQHINSTHDKWQMLHDCDLMSG